MSVKKVEKMGVYKVVGAKKNIEIREYERVSRAI